MKGDKEWAIISLMLIVNTVMIVGGLRWLAVMA